MQMRPRRSGMTQQFQQRLVEGNSILFAHRRFAFQTELVLDQGEGLGLVRRRLQTADELNAAVAVEFGTEQIEDRVDQPPGHIAAGQPDGQFGGVDLGALLQQPGAGGHGERHDQAEQDLEQALGRIEVAMDEANDHSAVSFALRITADSERVR